jgi:hypothetical protein
MIERRLPGAVIAAARLAMVALAVCKGAQTWAPGAQDQTKV